LRKESFATGKGERIKTKRSRKLHYDGTRTSRLASKESEDEEH